MRKNKSIGRCSVIAAVVLVGGWQMDALRTAAGGTSGQNGFADVSAFLDKLSTYLIYLAIPAGALGLIASGGALIAGNPNGSSMLARTSLGVGLVLLAKGIVA